MMKAAIPTAIALAASLASAQDFNTSAPFTLTLSSDDADIDGQLLGACHAGAAIEELCLSGTNDTATSYNTFTHNTTDTSGGASGESYPVGPLVWILPGSSFSESEGLAFNPLLESNVVAPEFFPGPSSDYVGFDDDDQLFLYSLYYDESTFEPGVFPTQITPVPLYQWYACYTYSLGYYYQTLAWVTAGEPINPTCQAVNVTRNFVETATTY